MRECVVCGVSFDPNGTAAICCSVECSKNRKSEYRKKWLEKNRQHLAEKRKERYEKTRKEDREYNLQKSKRWYEQNREYALEQCKRRYEQNREYALEQCRKYREQNPEISIRTYLRNYKGITNPPESLVKLATEIRLTKRLVRELAK